MNIRSSFIILALACLFGCAAPHPRKELYFTPWNTDASYWNWYELNGVEFKVPAELPRVPLGSRILAFCFSGYASEGYLAVPYVPSEAVYVGCREKDKIQSDDMDKFISVIQKQNGYLKKVSQPISGYQFWEPGDYQNKDNSIGVKGTSEVIDVSWGYLFCLQDAQVCEVYVRKWCRVPYSQLDVDQFVSPEEKKLVEDIVSTIKPIQ
jgi:hypothetical protein